jgi:hypothetical protein
MKKLINSVNGDVTDTPAGGGAAPRGRAYRTRDASATALAGMAAAHPARTVDDAQRPELTRSRYVRVDIPALRRGR